MHLVSLNPRHGCKSKEEKYKSFYLSPWNTYQKLSYRINKDVKFRVGPWKADKMLKEGLNFVRNHTIKVSKLATYRHGLCTMIEPMQKILVGQDFRLRIEWKNLMNSTDMPEKLNLYLTSKKGWHGIVLDDWPYIKPAQINLKSSISKKHGYTIKLSLKEKIYLQGSPNFKNCIRRLVSQFNCVEPCYPLIFNNVLDLQPCRGFNDTKCMVDHFFKYRKERNQCLKPMHGIIYEADKYHNAEYDDGSTSSFILKFHFMSPMVEILEEIPEISFPDFAGSVGGSLGLFIGFSCYTFLSKIVDKFFDYCF